MKLRVQALLVVALVTVLIGSACSTSDPAASAGDSVATEPSPREWLFSLQSSGPAGFDASTGELTVGVANLVGFTDRPYRDVRPFSPAEFAQLWQDNSDDSFNADPPNAALTYWDSDDPTATPRTVICEVVGAVDTDALGSTLTMTLKLLSPSGGALPATLFRASLFVDSLSTPCTPSDDDEMIIEYFNQENFNQAFVIEVARDTTGVSEFTLLCPERESENIPPESFDVVLSDVTGTNQSSCTNPLPIALPAGSPACTAQGLCDFTVTVRNTQTGSVYSQTELRLESIPGEVIPELNPATLPVCVSGAPLAMATPSMTYRPGGNGGAG